MVRGASCGRHLPHVGQTRRLFRIQSAGQLSTRSRAVAALDDDCGDTEISVPSRLLDGNARIELLHRPMTTPQPPQPPTGRNLITACMYCSPRENMEATENQVRPTNLKSRKRFRHPKFQSAARSSRSLAGTRTSSDRCSTDHVCALVKRHFSALRSRNTKTASMYSSRATVSADRSIAST